MVAVNGIGLGIGATILGFADLAFMSTTAKLKCPFTSLGVAPEAASSILFPRLIGQQNAAWMLMSSEWIKAAECLEMGLVWRVCEPDDLMVEARRHAEILASRPIASLVAVKRTMTEPLRAQIEEARDPGERSLRRAARRSGQHRGPHRLRRGTRARLHRPLTETVTSSGPRPP